MRIFLFMLFAIVVQACATPDISELPLEGDAYSEEVYRIGVGDQLQVSVWRNPELSVGVPVRPDGKISTPLVGDVLAAGNTPEDLAQALTDKLQAFIRSPKVTVVVTNPASAEFQQRVRVTGAVQGPTSVEYRTGMTVMDLVLVGGGANEFALLNKAKLYRVTKEGTKVYPVRLKDILEKGKLETNYKLLPSDIVTVPQRSF
ncbi:MAG: XrtA/PEP-CTERM system exopolysaccharide export protein [Pseudomonadales bacterium]